MLGKVFTYWRRLRKCLSMIRYKSKYVDQVSYYPECAHKTSFQILKDQLYYIWKYGYIEEYYFIQVSQVRNLRNLNYLMKYF